MAVEIGTVAFVVSFCLAIMLILLAVAVAELRLAHRKTASQVELLRHEVRDHLWQLLLVAAPPEVPFSNLRTLFEADFLGVRLKDLAYRSGRPEEEVRGQYQRAADLLAVRRIARPPH